MAIHRFCDRLATIAIPSAIATTITILLAPLALAETIVAGADVQPSAIEAIPLLEPDNRLAQAIAPDASTISEGLYSNEFFGFSLNFPEDWAIASQETRDEIMDLGTDIIAENNPALGATAAAALQDTYQLLLISQEPLESLHPTFNANVLAMAERVTRFPSLVSGADYLENHRALVGQTGLPYEAVGSIYAVSVGSQGQGFYRSDFKLGGIIEQSYIFTVDQDYAVGFILSGLPEQMPELEAIINSIQFEERLEEQLQDIQQ